MVTAEIMYKKIVDMPVREREKLFAVIARQGFEKEFHQHDEVFDDINKSPFSVKEASEYLEVAEITIRRWVTAKKLKAGRIGRNIVFDVEELKRFKRSGKEIGV